MDRPKYLKLITVSGIIITLLNFISVNAMSIASKQVSWVAILFSLAIMAFMIFVYLKLYQLKNWARDIIILLSVLGLIPVFNIKLAPWFLVYSFCVMPFSIFYIIYLMNGNVRAYFTDKKRSVPKIIGACLLILLGIGVSALTSYMGLFIDFSTGQLTPKAEAWLFQSDGENKKKIKELYGIELSEQYKVGDVKDKSEYTMIGLFAGSSKGRLIADQYIAVIIPKNKTNMQLDNAITFVNEDVKWERYMSYGDRKSLSTLTGSYPAINVKCKGADGLMVACRTPKMDIIFIGYVFSVDKAREYNDQFLKEAVDIFVK